MEQHTMTRASIHTSLSLSRWARILGVNPVHFSGAFGSAIWPDNGACEDIWPQYSWQTAEELIGREDVAMAIYHAEQDIKRALRASPALEWEVEEEHHEIPTYPSKATLVQTDYGMLVAPGRRAVSLIDADAAVVYSDPDSDGWDERATITVATSVTDVREIKVYYAGHAGAQEWEIRPLRTVTLSGGNAIITIDAWELIDPDLWEQYPTSTDFAGYDVTDSGNFVTAVDVYREYNDTTLAGVNFLPSSDGYLCCGGSGCDICSGGTYDGCFSIRNGRQGFVNVFAATYGENGWARAYPDNWRPTARVKLNYYAGYQDRAYLNRASLDPLSQYLAEAIVWLSVARLPSAVCSCNNVRERVEELQKDASRMREGSQASPIYARFTTQDIFTNPFGMKVGEVRAWQQVNRLIGEIGGGGAL